MEELILTTLGISSVESIPGLSTFLELWAIFRMVIIMLDGLLLILVAYSIYKGWQFRPNLELAIPEKSAGGTLSLRTEVNKERWKGVVKKGRSGPDGMRIAVIDADALVNDVLKQMGLEGEHMADRLSQIDPDEIGTLQKIWRAHRLRNDLVHTPGYYLSEQDAGKALEDFESFLKEVKAI